MGFRRRPAVRTGVLLAFGLLFLLTAGCGGYRPAQEACYLLAKARNHDRALTVLDRSPLAKNRRNRLLYLMEKGLLLHLKGDYPESNRTLEEADLLAEEFFTRSLSAEGLSFMTNDLVLPYAGEDFESVYINYYKTLNYVGLGELAEAAVESRRIDEKLGWFDASHDGRNRFREDAFLRLLTGLVFEAQGDHNNAFIAYRKSLEAYRAYEGKYGAAVPGLLWGRLAVSARRAGLLEEHDHYLRTARRNGMEPREEETLVAVIVGNGAIPVKEEVFALFPTPQGFPVKLAVPEFVDRPGGVAAVEASLDGETWLRAEQVQNLAAVARQSLADKKGRVLAKAAARAVAKQLAARQAEKELGPLAGLTAQVAALLTERADLRSWSTLPREILLVLVPAEPGCQRVQVRLGSVIETYEAEVLPGSIAFVFTRVL